MLAGPLISVIIPTYNRVALVCRAIDNVLEQTWKHLELIVVDDGSTDGTQEKLRLYGNRIRIITQANRGPSAARNKGIEIATGEIVAFQDSDDLWMPNKLERQVRLMQALGPSVPCCLCNINLGVIHGRNHTSFSYADMNPKQEEGLWNNVSEVLATRFVLFNQAVAIRRVVLEKLGGFDESLNFLEDYDMALRLSAQEPWGFIREPLVVYGDDGDARSSHQAERNYPALLQKECTILERSLVRAAAARDARLSRMLKSRLSRLHRHQVAATLHVSDSPLLRASAAVLFRASRLQQGLFRRSPWYPAMKTGATPVHTALHGPSCS